jgi:hypothetical protein
VPGKSFAKLSFSLEGIFHAGKTAIKTLGTGRHPGPTGRDGHPSAQDAAEERIRIVLDGLRGETSIAELCRREGIAESMYLSGSESRILLRHQQYQGLGSD